MFQVTNEGTACVVRDACPKGVDCPTREPYAYECGYHMVRAANNQHPLDENTRLYADVGGACFERPFGCSVQACLLGKTECPPPPPSSPPPPVYWTVKRKGDACTVVEQPRTSISREQPAYTIPCPAGYEEPIVGVRLRDHPRGGEDSCEVDMNQQCEPGWTCNPPEPRAVRCPSRP